MPTISEVNRQAMKHLTIEDGELLRGAYISDILRRRAQIMSAQVDDARFYGYSSPVDHVEAFISHNWSTPRRQKFLTLAHHFNALPAFLVTLAVAVVAFGLTLGGVLPVMQEHGELTLNRHVGVSCQISGSVAFVLTLLFWHEIGARLCLPGHVIFLDKVCVHQTDTELKRRGILSLAAILSYSWSMVVLYSDVYLQKLWTVYEITTYMLMYPEGNLCVRPVFFPRVVLSGTLFVATIRVLNAIVWSEPFQNWLGRWKLVPLLDDMVVGFLADLFLIVAMSVILQWWAEKQELMAEQLQDFDIHNAECFSEDDRHIVEDNVMVFSKHFGLCDPSERREEVLAAFNTLVHNNVPRVLDMSLGRAGVQYKDAAMIFIVYHLYTLDCLGAMVGTCSWKKVCVVTAHNIFVGAFVGPLTIAVCAWLTRRFARWRVGRSSVCTVGFLPIIVATWLFYDGSHYFLLCLGRDGMRSRRALLLFVGLLGFYAVVTYAVYRPQHTASAKRRRLGVSSSSDEDDSSEYDSEECSEEAEDGLAKLRQPQSRRALTT